MELLAVPYEERDVLDPLIDYWSYQDLNAFEVTDQEETGSDLAEQDNEGYESDSTIASHWTPHSNEARGEGFTGVNQDQLVNLSNFRPYTEYLSGQ